MGETTVNNIKLTLREMSILQEVAIGRPTPQIAQNLGLSPETVKWYRKRLLVKFSAIMNNIL
jgi:DNA-binding CsgD family transcriptional regulator